MSRDKTWNGVGGLEVGLKAVFQCVLWRFIMFYHVLSARRGLGDRKSMENGRLRAVSRRGVKRLEDLPGVSRAEARPSLDMAVVAP